MKKIITFLLITLGLFCCSGTAYAKWQIQFDAKANRVMRLGGNTLRGNFATKEQCLDYWRSRSSFEQNHSKCVGCDEQNSSQTHQGMRRSRFQDNNIRQKQLREEAEHQQMIRQQKQKEEQSRAEFYQGKKKMLRQLKGGSSGGGLNLKGGETKLVLKSGNAPAKNQGSASKDQLQQAEQRLTELRTDVKAMQSALQLYQDGLMNNVSTLDQQADEITKRSNDLLYDGIQYIFSVASDRFMKSKSKSIFTEPRKKKYEDFIKTINNLKEIKEKEEQISWLINTPNDTNKLIGGAEMLAKDSLKNIADNKLGLDDIPLWKHVKMNYKAWSSVGKVCVSWMKINDNKQGIADYSRAVKTISLHMQMTVEEINCLKECMAESNNGCVKKCSQ